MTQRTDQQNRALHLYCDHVADALNDGGFDKVAVLSQKAIPVLWTGEAVKEELFKSVMRAMCYDENGEPKESTTQLDKMEVDAVYRVLDRWLAEKFGVSVPFPSEETMSRRAA